MMSLKDQLDNCEYLLADAEMAGDWNAVRRFREYRLRLVRQLCRQRLPVSAPRVLTSAVSELSPSGRLRSAVARVTVGCSHQLSYRRYGPQCFSTAIFLCRTIRARISSALLIFE